MREKELRLIVTFHTTANAMAMESLCKCRGLAGRLIPVPRAITSDCGIGWSCPPQLREEITAALEEEHLEAAAFTEMMV